MMKQAQIQNEDIANQTMAPAMALVPTAAILVATVAAVLWPVQKAKHIKLHWTTQQTAIVAQTQAYQPPPKKLALYVANLQNCR